MNEAMPETPDGCIDSLSAGVSSIPIMCVCHDTAAAPGTSESKYLPTCEHLQALSVLLFVLKNCLADMFQRRLVIVVCLLLFD